MTRPIRSFDAGERIKNKIQFYKLEFISGDNALVNCLFKIYTTGKWLSYLFYVLTLCLVNNINIQYKHMFMRISITFVILYTFNLFIKSNIQYDIMIFKFHF